MFYLTLCRRKFSSVFKVIIFNYHKDDPFQVNAVIVNKLSVCNLTTNLFSFWAGISRWSGKPDLILCSFIKRHEHQATNSYLSDKHCADSNVYVEPSLNLSTNHFKVLLSSLITPDYSPWLLNYEITKCLDKKRKKKKEEHAAGWKQWLWHINYCLACQAVRLELVVD